MGSGDRLAVRVVRVRPRLPGPAEGVEEVAEVVQHGMGGPGQLVERVAEPGVTQEGVLRPILCTQQLYKISYK